MCFHVRRFNELPTSQAKNSNQSSSDSSLAQILKVFVAKRLVGEAGSEPIVVPNLEMIQARVDDNLTSHFGAFSQQRAGLPPAPGHRDAPVGRNS